MAEAYVTLGEAAELEGVQYSTMARRTQRKKDAFVTKTEKSETGGRDVVLVAVSSLSKQARNAWKEREKLKSFTEGVPEGQEAEQKPEVPWYVDMDIDWYIENYKERYYKAVELGNVVRKFLQYGEGDRTKYAEEFAQKHLGKGQRTLYRYTKAYLEASAWADKLQKEDGAGYEFFKVLCLCRKPKETGCFPSIKPEVKQVIKNIWFNEDFARNQGTREMLYEKLTAIANINLKAGMEEWEKIPSYQTVVRYINYLMEDENMKNAYFLASRGTREYKNKVMVKGSRDTKGLQVMQIVMGDEHTFDCWVSYRQPNGKVIAIKPHLAAWVDMRSRVIMGDVLCKDANSDILKQSLLKMMYSEPGGVPEYLYIDNGNGKYASDPTELEKKVREFLEASGGVDGGQEQEGGKAGAGILKKKVEFFESRDFVQTIGVCQACQEYMGLGIIVGKSGQGKTHALKKYAELPRVAYIECDDTMACRDLVEAIENGIGLPRGYGGTIWKRVNRIREFFNTNEGFLLIIDEADKLINKYTQKKMEILRGIFDQSDVGIVIAGEPRLETELKGNLARFANRMDFYYKLKGLSKNEVADYLEGYEVEEAAMSTN